MSARPLIDTTPEHLLAITRRGKEIAAPRDFQGRLVRGNNIGVGAVQIAAKRPDLARIGMASVLAAAVTGNA